MKAILRFVGVLAAMCVAASVASAQQSSDPEGYLNYSLPKTVLVLEVEAVQVNFYAGPYAAYAEKYLGITVPQEDKQTYQLKSVKMTPYVEPDNSRRYSVNIPKGDLKGTFWKLTPTGLVSFADARFGDEAMWRFPVAGKGDFSDKGVLSNLTSDSANLYHNNDDEAKYAEILIQQGSVVEKSLDKRASEAAQKILTAREEKYKIVVGDTDATYSGEALQAAIDELTRMEKEYLLLFTGYTETQVQKARFDVVPQEGEQQKYIAFRISDSEGLVPADNLSGRPIVLEIVAEQFAKTDVKVEEEKTVAEAAALEETTGKPVKVKQPVEKREVKVYYRLPATCTVNVKNGVNLLLQSRVPVYQLGQESSLPVNVIL